MCVICQYAEQFFWNPPKYFTALPPIPTIRGLSDHILEPGQRVSVDFYVAMSPDCLPNIFGKEKVESQFTDGAIFVDHS